ncbi:MULTISPECIES: hypothetical protein [Staphylococcus]|nr:MULTISPECIES: hypothetical protein [Staphylococcus]MDQ7114055.1 hypothetical protein [Staphylococcus simulans]PTI91740.1 hypothetical protein BU045_12155 [Staphylococcus simulans]PTJ05468.1 hypothetical protein BU046_04710 [Staphylococcus simulans]PTJ10322.1 hypothetical protein BU044_06045 [Staphylococcus simulans]PTJ26521.1 hypothetical protein BU035_09205 [Staphylococcus simulans]
MTLFSYWLNNRIKKQRHSQYT